MSNVNSSDFIKSLRDISGQNYHKPKDYTDLFKENLYNDAGSIKYLYERGINNESIDYFNIGLFEKNEEKWLVFPVYEEGKLIDYKYRSLPPAEKSFRRVKGSKSWIFHEQGLKEAKEENSIYVTEGEIDCITLWQNGHKNVISSSSGVGFIGSWIKQLDDIDKVYLVLDNDNAGREAAKKFAERLQKDKCYDIVLPEKDINDFFLKHGDKSLKEFKKIVKQSKPISLKGIFRLDEVIDDVRNNDKEKEFKFSVPKLDHKDATGGFERGEVMVISASSGLGKTTWVSNILMNLAKNSQPILFIPLEGNFKYTAQRLLTIYQGSSFQDWQEEDWGAIKDKLLDFPFYVYKNPEGVDNMAHLEEIISGVKKIYDVHVVALDHFHYFINRAGNNPVQEAEDTVKKLSLLAQKYNIALLIVAHIKFARKYKKPDRNDLKGTSSLYQDPDKVFFLWKEERDENNSDILRLYLEKNRNGPGVDEVLLNFDSETGVIKEKEDALEYRTMTESGKKDDNISDELRKAQREATKEFKQKEMI